MRPRNCLAALSLLLAATWTAPARAAEIMDYIGNVGEVVLPGLAETPLYLHPSQGMRPCVKVTIQGEEFLFALEPGYGISVSDRVSGALKLEPKEKTLRHYNGGAPIHYANIDRISVGSLELRDVWVSTDPEAPKADLAPRYASPEGSVGVDGVIGLQSLGVAWAVLPSQGKVFFAPRDQGGDMVAGLQAEILRYRTTPEQVEVYGKSGGSKNKQRMKPSGPIVPLNVAAQQIDVDLSFGAWASAMRSDREMPESAIEQIGDRRYSWQPVQIGKQPPQFSWVRSSGSYRVLQDRAYRNSYADGLVGNNVLSQFDIASSPEGRSITFRYAPEQKRVDPFDWLLADAQADTTPEDGEEVAPGTWQRVGDLYHSRGRLEEAIDAYSKPLEDEEQARSCSPWIQLGIVQAEANRVEDAIASFSAASERYHAWWDRSLEEREMIQEQLAELEEGERKNAADLPQPGLCFHADARLAAAHLASGDLDAVTALYAERLDLDADLALVAGNAYLLQGDLDAAQSAYRQANQLANKETSAVRLGLALAYEAAGDWDSAQELYAAALESRDSDAMAVLMWLDASTRATSAPRALRQALAFRRLNPDNGVAYVAIARAAQRAGDEEELKRVTEAGERFFTRMENIYPHSTTLQATQALFLLELGRADDARQLAEQTLLLDPGNVLAWLALGNVYVLKGDIERGERLLRRAGRLAPMHPGYAMLIGAEIPRPTADAGDIDAP